MQMKAGGRSVRPFLCPTISCSRTNLDLNQIWKDDYHWAFISLSLIPRHYYLHSYRYIRFCFSYLLDSILASAFFIFLPVKFLAMKNFVRCQTEGSSGDNFCELHSVFRFWKHNVNSIEKMRSRSWITFCLPIPTDVPWCELLMFVLEQRTFRLQWAAHLL